MLKKKSVAQPEHAGKIAVLVTTDSSKRGVFAGFIDPSDVDKQTMEISELRMCVYWSTDMKSVLGLASMGPSKICKISKAVKKATLQGVTAVIELSDEAGLRRGPQSGPGGQKLGGGRRGRRRNGCRRRCRPGRLHRPDA